MELMAGSRKGNIMKKTTGKPQPFGVEVNGDRVNFSLCVPKGKKCELLLYKTGSEEPEVCYEMLEKDGIGEVRFLAVEGLDSNQYEYHYRIDKKIMMDPYAVEVSGRKIFGEKTESDLFKAKIVSADYDWEEDQKPDLPWNDVIAYSIHVRGFTKHRTSKVTHKGTFLGVIEKIPYLKELGINQIQCMPVYEFDECLKTKINYWGYGPALYFAPKASYSAQSSSIHELKDLVKACHKEKIEVVLEMPFAQDIHYQTAVECLRYYMMEYHVDGFIINPYILPWEMVTEDPFLKGVKIMRKDDGFQNIMRRFLKGDENMINDLTGAMRHNSAVDGKCNYITGQTGFTLWDLVSYDGKHNEANGEKNTDGPDYNFSWNCGAEGPSRKRSVVSLRKSQVRNALLLLLLSQGTPCLLAGDEFYNSQKGNNNVYCQDNETGWVDWSKLQTDRGLFDYVRALIAFRKKHLCFHRAEELKGMDRTACGMPDISFHGESAWQIKNDVASRQLGVLYAGVSQEDPACFVAYNMHWIPHTFAIPSPGKGCCWHLVADTDRGILDQSLRLEDQKQLEIRERSISVLVSVKEEVGSENEEKIRKKDLKQEREKHESNTTLSNNHKA